MSVSGKSIHYQAINGYRDVKTGNNGRNRKLSVATTVAETETILNQGDLDASRRELLVLNADGMSAANAIQSIYRSADMSDCINRIGAVFVRVGRTP
jgi:hypothetical protein